MVASSRVQILSNKSEEISVLYEFLKNPNFISSLEDEVKKLNDLTADEEEALHEARIAIQSKAEAETELKDLQDKIAKSIAGNEAKISARITDTNIWIDAEEKKIADEYTLIESKKAEQEATVIRLQQWENKLKETAAVMKGLVE